MEYQGYFTKEELLTRIELAFPFVLRPPDSELFAYDNNDLMCKIIKDRISTYTGEVIPYEGVSYLYGEVGSYIISLFCSQIYLFSLPTYQPTNLFD